MRFISIASLIFQGKRTEAYRELVSFIKYYKSLSNRRPGAYAVSKKFIRENGKLKGNEKKLLGDLIRILESPEKAEEKRLEELELRIKTIFKDKSSAAEK
jgi:hypothetical protein